MSFIRWIKAICEFLYRRKNKNMPKFVLTVWKKELLNPEWTSNIEGFDVVSVKVADGVKEYHKEDAAEVIEAASSAGKEVHGWGFHYSTSEDYARKEGEVAAGLCESLSLSGYHWNAEKEWAASDEPDDNAIAFAQSFRLRAPGVKLFANCFNTPVNEVMLAHYDYYEPMIYGTRISTIAGKFQKRFGTPSIDESKRCAMVGTGRINTKNTKQAWGYLNSTGSDFDESGLDRLVRDFKPTYLNFFRAGIIDGEDIMMAPNDINPVLSEQVTVIKDSIK